MDTVLTEHYLPGSQTRARLMHMESAAILKRFLFCEEALIRGQAGWLAAIAPLELKVVLPRHIWEDAQVGGALRQRVFELRYPSRLMEIGADAPLVSLFEAARHAPNAAAYLGGLARVLVPALERAHVRLAAQYRRPFFDSPYVTWDQLAHNPLNAASGPHAHGNHFQRRVSHERHPVNCHTLAHHGIRIRGPRRQELDICAPQHAAARAQAAQETCVPAQRGTAAAGADADRAARAGALPGLRLSAAGAERGAHAAGD